jgi:hypothetical protein
VAYTAAPLRSVCCNFSEEFVCGASAAARKQHRVVTLLRLQEGRNVEKKRTHCESKKRKRKSKGPHFRDDGRLWERISPHFRFIVGRVASKRAQGGSIAPHSESNGPRFRNKPRHFASIGRRGLSKKRTGKDKKPKCRLAMTHFMSKKPRVRSNAPPRKLSARKNRLARPWEVDISRTNRIPRSSERYVVPKNGE